MLINGERLLAALDDVRTKCRTAGAEELENAVMDLMDRVSGWCSPHYSLVVEQPQGTIISIPPADHEHAWEPAEIACDTTGYIDRDWLRCGQCGGMVKRPEGWQAKSVTSNEEPHRGPQGTTAISERDAALARELVLRRAMQAAILPEHANEDSPQHLSRLRRTLAAALATPNPMADALLEVAAAAEKLHDEMTYWLNASDLPIEVLAAEDVLAAAIEQWRQARGKEEDRGD